ncbi:hypothetical protein Trydic_g21147 [Trypoxylus dichotomus]
MRRARSSGGKFIDRLPQKHDEGSGLIEYDSQRAPLTRCGYDVHLQNSKKRTARPHYYSEMSKPFASIYVILEFSQLETSLNHLRKVPVVPDEPSN